jgi:kinesin family protein 5
MENGVNVKQTYTPQSSSATKTNAKPSVKPTTTKHITKKSSQLSISSQGKDTPVDRPESITEVNRVGTTAKSLNATSKADLDRLENQRGGNATSKILDSKNADINFNTNEDIKGGSKKSIKDKEEEKDQTTQRLPKAVPSISNVNRSYNKLDDDFKAIDSNGSNRGSDANPLNSASVVQKAKISLERPQTGRSRSNSTILREKELSQMMENGRTLSRKGSVSSNQSVDLALIKQTSTEKGAPASINNLATSLSTKNATGNNVFFSDNSVNVNNFNNVFFSGQQSAQQKKIDRKKPAGLNFSRAITQGGAPTGAEALQTPVYLKSINALASTLGLAPKDFGPPSSNKVQSSNIKVVARFRPLNKMEQELMQNGLGTDAAVFPDDNSVYVLPDSNTIITLDRVFSPASCQADVYDFVGKETLDDVLAGYNGTIFAYGQTSSGKTFTMFGDLHEDEMRGIIPRAMRHIFDHIGSVSDYDTEFVLKCSMLEIYKENLYDLLNDRNSDLKIKENPRKGIYVDGLHEENVVDEEELLNVLEIGGKAKMMAATRMNQHSSRSHTLFIMEITQQLPNQSEKKGRLNLVDLAGSEKISKTGAQGETLEEAKKINLSLSCLGNVINALTTGADHIPYRDSKLTRILQDSLGGNYKTSLVVTCSPHSSNREESISTLKFASRAKTIKTHYKMNIMSSPESLAIIVEQLRLQLEDARNELAKYKNGEIPTEVLAAAKQLAAVEQATADFMEPQRFSRFRPARVRDPEENLPKLDWNLGADIYTPVALTGVAKKSNYENMTKTADLAEMGEFKQIVTNNLNLGNELSHILQVVDVEKTKKHYNSYSYFKTNLELINQNETLELRVHSLKKEVNRLNSLVEEKDSKLKKQEEENMDMKNSLLQLESKLSHLSEHNQMSEMKFDKNNDSTEHLKITCQVLEKQVNAITEALLSCEQSIESLLKEKANMVSMKFNDVLSQNLEFKQIKLADYFQFSYNFNFEPFYAQSPVSKKHFGDDDRDEPIERGSFISNSQFKESFISQLDLHNAFTAVNNKLTGVVEVPSQINSLLNQGNYGTMIQKSIVDEKISPELTIYLLKQQLYQCMIINKHLERVIAALEWKQIIEYGKAKIKSNYTKMQERQIRNIEKVLEKAAISHQQLRNRVEAVEMDAIKLREAVLNQDSRKVGTPSHMNVHKPPTRAVRTTNRRLTIRKLLKEKDMENFSHRAERAEMTMIFNQRDRLKTDEEEFDGPSSKRNNTGVSFAKGTDSPRATLDPSNLLRDIEKELALVSGNPNTVEESRVIINLQRKIIDQLRGSVSYNSFQVASPSANLVTEREFSQYVIPSNEAEYLRSEKERLENKVLILQTELDLEKTRSEQLKEAYLEGNKQINNYKKLCEELEIASRNALKMENENWQKIFDELKGVQEREVTRKQDEVRKLHDLLAGWIFKYMELQEIRGVTPSHQEKILFETYKKKEIPDKAMLEKALSSNKHASTPVTKTVSQQPDRKSVELHARKTLNH